MTNSIEPAILALGASCENRCFFCRRKSRGCASARLIEDFLTAARKAGKTRLVFEGLEPTSDPILENAARLAVRLGFTELRLETNGISLSSAAFLKRIALAGINEVSIMLPASDSLAYGTITGNSAGFKMCIDAIKRSCAMRGMKTSIRIPVCAENAAAFPDIIRLAASTGVRGVVLDVAETCSFWPAGAKAPIMIDIETAVNAAAKHGVSISLKGRTVHQAGSFSDGRIEKVSGGDSCLLTYYRPGRAQKREIFSADFRLTYKCNQRCVFCAAENEFLEPSADKLETRLSSLLNSNIQRICFEGGEPTLFPRLPEFLEKARLGGVREITLMTNAVRSASPVFARKIVEAGANRIFVSLHACEPELSDGITRSPGTFEKTIEGIHNFLSLDARTYLIFVMMSRNMETLPEYVRFVHREFGNIPVLLSMVTPYISPALESNLIPSYSSMRPVIEKAAATAARLGVPLSAMEEQHRPPDCVLPGARTIFRNLFAPIDKKESAAGFVKPAQCALCAKNSSCPGVREFYARAHGTKELVPVEREAGRT